MIPKRADAVIIGSGAMGLSTAYYLAIQGYSNIVILEQDSYIGGYNTSCCAGGFRHQFATEINIQLSKMSIDMLKNFNGVPDYEVDISFCGYMFVLTENDDIEQFKRAICIQKELGIDTQWLTVKDLKKDLPMINFDDAVGATYYQGDGLIDVGNVINSYIKALRRLNVEILTNTSVIDIELLNGKLNNVVTSKGKINTPVVVNAAGPWSQKICDMVNVKLPVKSVLQQLFVTSDIPWANEKLPVVIFPTQGIGIHKEGRGLLTGLHKPEPIEDQFKISVDREWEMKHCEELIKRIPSIENCSIISSWAGLYSMTSDLHPIIGRVPGVEGFFCITGFSGHGFMHSPACGLLLSEEIIYGKAKSLDISSLYIDRFYSEGNRTTEFYRI